MSVNRLMDEAEQRIRAKEIFTVVDANAEIRTDVTVITNLQKEASKRKKELETYKQRSDNPFTLINMEITKELTALQELNTKELGYFLILQSYIDYSNMIRKEDSTLPMTEKELGQALKIKNRKHYIKVIDKFIELGLMYRQPVTLYKKVYQAFYINTDYCFRGSNKSSKVVSMFIGSLQELYDQGDIKPANIGFLFMILPYMHYQSNHLVKLPYEREYAKAEAVTQADIIEITGLDKKHVQSHMRVKLSGVHVFGTFRAGRCSVYKVNPSLFFRGVKPDEVLLADFKLTGESL